MNYSTYPIDSRRSNQGKSSSIAPAIQLTNSLANSNSTATGIPSPLNYSTQPSRITHQQNQAPITGWEEYDVVDIAEAEYLYALRQLSCLRHRAANRPRRSFDIPDPSVELAELQVKTAANVLERMIDLRLKREVQDEPIAPGPCPPSPTYSEFSDIPVFSSRSTTPVHGGDSRETGVRNHFARREIW